MTSKLLRLLQAKATAGYRDVNGFIKAKILNTERISINIIIGKTAIIDTDITHQLQDATGFYDLSFTRINLSNENEIIAALKSAAADIVIISRGGGERMEIFDRPSIAAVALSIKPLFVTAIGHSQDNSLLQKIADKAFITPTALGQYLNDLYNQTMEERSRSKARLVDDITKQLKPLYEKQVQNLQVEMKNKEENFLNQKQLLEERLTMAQHTPAGKINWLSIALLLLAGMVLGALVVYLSK